MPYLRVQGSYLFGPKAHLNVKMHFASAAIAHIKPISPVVVQIQPSDSNKPRNHLIWSISHPPKSKMSTRVLNSLLNYQFITHSCQHTLLPSQLQPKKPNSKTLSKTKTTKCPFSKTLNPQIFPPISKPQLTKISH